ncbi:hypothetical protein [Jongsikchunia kroppenstedtii]|uniref:hypothetical protein n=1 Tax=Jongsikchunia kroppenstedtii TaxID=1121721 RepID=UPI0012DEDE37|nr:hypothetical protein [Jongsikchunia kroppenstedtii]
MKPIWWKQSAITVLVVAVTPLTLAGCGTSANHHTSSSAKSSPSVASDSPDALIYRAQHMYQLVYDQDYSDAYKMYSARCAAKLSESQYVAEAKTSFSANPLAAPNTQHWAIAGGGTHALVIRYLTVEGGENTQKRYWTYEEGVWKYDQCN